MKLCQQHMAGQLIRLERVHNFRFSGGERVLIPPNFCVIGAFGDVGKQALQPDACGFSGFIVRPRRDQSAGDLFCQAAGGSWKKLGSDCVGRKRIGQLPWIVLEDQASVLNQVQRCRSSQPFRLTFCSAVSPPHRRVQAVIIYGLSERRIAPRPISAPAECFIGLVGQRAYDVGTVFPLKRHSQHRRATASTLAGEHIGGGNTAQCGSDDQFRAIAAIQHSTNGESGLQL